MDKGKEGSIETDMGKRREGRVETGGRKSSTEEAKQDRRREGRDVRMNGEK